MSNFKPLVPVSNWGYWYELDGKPLQDGEFVEIRFPDGSVEACQIQIEDHGYESAKEGHIPNSVPYAVIATRGMRARIEITDNVGVRRVKPKDGVRVEVVQAPEDAEP